MQYAYSTSQATQLANVLLMYKTCCRRLGGTESSVLNDDWQIMTIHDIQQLGDGCENGGSDFTNNVQKYEQSKFVIKINFIPFRVSVSSLTYGNVYCLDTF
jgi:hypothetical protein